MYAHVRTWRWLGAAVILASLGVTDGAWASAAAVSGGRPDILDMPARQSERAKSAVLTAVAAAGKRLVAVGERSAILLSDDDGKSWRQAKSVPTSVALTAVSFVSDKVGWAVGHSGAILRTGDGGETWERQLEGRKAAEIEAAAADAAAAGASAPTRRQREAQRMLAEGADKPFLDVRFFDEQRGMVVGAYGLAFATQDGGKTWESLMGRLENPNGRHLYRIEPLGKGLLIAGEQGTLLRAGDAGQSFAPLPVKYPGTFFGALVATDGALVAFGLRGNAFRSTDGGGTWSKVDFALPVTLTAGIRLRDGRLAVVDETGRVMLSRDGGATFASLAVAKMNAATGVVEAADGALVVATQRGAVRVAPEALGSEQKK
ncbi:MAG: hypothetical protein H6R10_3206 [Rhodocyclaceae bacterium]|nr:hypothetical protein [Rhodocyclaceae bacterium]